MILLFLAPTDPIFQQECSFSHVDFGSLEECYTYKIWGPGIHNFGNIHPISIRWVLHAVGSSPLHPSHILHCCFHHHTSDLLSNLANHNLTSSQAEGQVPVF